MKPQPFRHSREGQTETSQRLSLVTQGPGPGGDWERELNLGDPDRGC